MARPHPVSAAEAELLQPRIQPAPGVHAAAAAAAAAAAGNAAGAGLGVGNGLCCSWQLTTGTFAAPNEAETRRCQCGRSGACGGHVELTRIASSGRLRRPAGAGVRHHVSVRRDRRHGVQHPSLPSRAAQLHVLRRLRQRGRAAIPASVQEAVPAAAVEEEAATAAVEEEAAVAGVLQQVADAAAAKEVVAPSSTKVAAPAKIAPSSATQAPTAEHQAPSSGEGQPPSAGKPKSLAASGKSPSSGCQPTAAHT
eukprot:SM000237S08119  [mRNA]  locus=s237:67357:68361:+ [translate_table: standard]